MFQYQPESTSEQCSYNPCFNGGMCVKQGENFKCVCADGYTGLVCQGGEECAVSMSVCLPVFLLASTKRRNTIDLYIQTNMADLRI